MSSTHIPAHLEVLLRTDIRNKADRLVLVDALLDEDMLDEAADVRGSWKSLSSNYHAFADDEPAIAGRLIADRVVNGTDIGEGYALVRTLDDRYAVVWGNLHSREWNVLPSIAGEDREIYGDNENGYRLYQPETEAKYDLLEIAEAMMQIGRDALAGLELAERVSGSENSGFPGLSIGCVQGTNGWHALIRDGYHNGTILSWNDRAEHWEVFQIDQDELSVVERIAIVKLTSEIAPEDGIDNLQIACDLDRGIFVVDATSLAEVFDIYGEDAVKILYRQTEGA